MAVHVRCNSLYISLPPFGKQQREMTMLCVFSFENKRWRYIFSFIEFCDI